jgi:iron complex transport system ATP-binding protein
MSATPSALLEAENLTLVRDGQRILDGVSLEVTAGRVLAVIGPNGAGKSSLLAVLSGWWTPDGGRVLLDGRTLADFDAAGRARRCAVMRQENVRPSGLAVLEAIELGGLARAAGAEEARDLAWEMLRRMDLEALAARDCSRLSGGEWQRVVFARAVAQIWKQTRPGVVLLDEPVSSLDPSHQHSLLAEARRLARDGHAVLAVLHDLNLTAQYADEVALMREGRLRACGPAADLMQPDILSEIYGCPVAAVEDPVRGLRSLVSLPAGSV